MQNAPPIIFIAGANDENRTLRNIPHEIKAIRRAFAWAEREKRCELLTRTSLELNELFDLFQDERYRGRICLFHFAGHANDWQLLLEAADRSERPVFAQGLLAFLSSQQGLKIVVLNACSTARQAAALRDAGIPLVIATDEVVRDEAAYLFASRLYQGMGQDVPLHPAYQAAKQQVLADKGALRDLIDIPHAKISSDYKPWQWFQHVAAEGMKTWSLSQESGDPLAFLPSIPQTHALPNKPFRGIRRFERAHAEIFFGRGASIRDLYFSITMPKGAPLILFYGKSGVGKSSLLEAGLMPRLEESYQTLYLRRREQTPMLQSWRAALQADEITALRDAWLRQEKRQGKPLLVMLDQVEEIFTRPLAPAQELTELMRAIKTLFATPAQRPAGRLILSYRKEYHAEIKEAVDTLEIDNKSAFLDRLTRSEMVEAITGVTLSPRLHDKYQLEIEADLPEIIAQELEHDTTAVIAPLLQVLLLELWNQATLANDAAPTLTLIGYRALRQTGSQKAQLVHFFQRQMDKLRAWNAEPVDNGLALDVLHFHLTDSVTANQHSRLAIQERYAHQPESLIHNLVEQLKAVYLLGDAPKMGKLQGTVLSHDILAPLVRSLYLASEKPGQLADKILRRKIEPYLVKQAAGTADLPPAKMLLTAQEVADSEAGKSAMRAWTRAEKALLVANRKQVRRQRRQKRMLIVGALLLLVVGVIAGLAWRQQYSNQLWAEGEALLANNPNQALQKMVQAWRMDRRSLLKRRSVYETYRQHLFFEHELQLPHPKVQSATFSPDGRYLAFATGSSDWTVYWYDRQEGKLLDTLTELRLTATSLAFSADNRSLSAGSQARSIREWSLLAGQDVRYVPTDRDSSIVNAIAYSPDGKWLASGHKANFVDIWQRADQTITKRISLPAAAQQLAIPNTLPATVAVVRADSYFSIYNWVEDAIVTTAKPVGEVSALAASPNESKFALATGNRIQMLTLEGNALLPSSISFTGHSAAIQCLAYSPNGKLLLSGSSDKTARLWDSNTGRLLYSLRGHQAAIIAASFTTDQQSILTIDARGRVLSWPLPYDVPYNAYTTPDTFPAPAIAAQLSSGLPLLVIAAKGRKVYTFDANSQELKAVFDRHDYKLSALAIDHEREYVASADQRGTIWLWPLQNPGQGLVLEQHQARIRKLAISTNNDCLLAVSDDTGATLFPLSGGSPIKLEGHQAQVQYGTFSPDGQQVLTVSLDSTLRQWSVADGRQLAQYAFPETPTFLTFLPDNRSWLVAATNDTTYRYEAAGSRHFWLAEQVVAWSPTNEYYISWLAARCALHVRDAETNDLIRSWIVPTSAGGDCTLRSISISTDGLWVLTTHRDGRILRWRQDRPPLSVFLGTFAVD